jgi:signal transduction histidine kinase
VQKTDENIELGAAEIEQFMAIAAHDVRNPVAVVRASAQMAQRSIARGDMAAAQGRLTAIVEQTDRMTEILETFVDAARVGSAHLQLRRERVNLQDIVEAATTRARLIAGDRANRDVECDVPDGLIGMWDRARIVRAVRALVANALQYGEASAPVRLDACRKGSCVRLTITGGGPGPDTEEVEHLFERFYRGRSAADAGQSGSGLGLFTARGIARAHDGEVRRIAGDIFEIELPLSD